MYKLAKSLFLFAVYVRKATLSFLYVLLKFPKHSEGF